MVVCWASHDTSQSVPSATLPSLRSLQTKSLKTLNPLPCFREEVGIISISRVSEDFCSSWRAGHPWGAWVWFFLESSRWLIKREKWIQNDISLNSAKTTLILKGTAVFVVVELPDEGFVSAGPRCTRSIDWPWSAAARLSWGKALAAEWISGRVGDDGFGSWKRLDAITVKATDPVGGPTSISDGVGTWVEACLC